MNTSRLPIVPGALFFALVLSSVLLLAQDEKKPALLSPSARLAAAKTVFIKNAGGSEIPYNVISEAMLGWGRFQPAESAEKADLVMEVTSPDDSKASTVARSGVSASTGRPEDSVTTSKELNNGPIKLVVYDGKNHVPLWSGSERAKYAMKQKSWDDNLVDAAQKLFAQFHQRIEPDAAK